MEVIMKNLSLTLAVFGLMLALVGPAAAASTGQVGLGNIFACKDTARVSVFGTSSYAVNRVKIRVFVRSSQSEEYTLRAKTFSENFDGGDFSLDVIVGYSDKAIDAGADIRIDAQLQRQSSGGFVDLGNSVSAYTQVADQFCRGRCAVTINSTDKVPAKGTITLRTHFGSWFRPEGRTYGALPVNAGTALRATFAGLPCGMTARIWYYPATGKDRTPRLLPAQYWPTDFGIDSATDGVVYVTSFARSLPATRPLESDDPYAPK
jgi:hypothetical protein